MRTIKIMKTVAIDLVPEEVISIQELKEIYISVKKEISSLIGNVEAVKVSC